MTSYELSQIQGSISDRQRELHDVTDTLAKAAQATATRASIAKVLLVLLGAFVATREAASQLLGSTSSVSIIVYTLAGLLVAVIAGLEAAFRWEGRATELRILAATCQATVRMVDSQWQKEIGTVPDDQKLNAARKLLDTQDTKLSEVQEKAAAIGVNITLVIRELDHQQGRYLA